MRDHVVTLLLLGEGQLARDDIQQVGRFLVAEHVDGQRAPDVSLHRIARDKHAVPVTERDMVLRQPEVVARGLQKIGERELIVPGDAGAVLINEAQVRLRLHIALRGGAGVPGHRLRFVLGGAFARGVAVGDHFLARRIAGVRPGRVPLEGQALVLRNAEALVIEEADGGLRAGPAAVRRFLQPVAALVKVLHRADSIAVHEAHHFLGGDIALLRTREQGLEIGFDGADSLRCARHGKKRHKKETARKIKKYHRQPVSSREKNFPTTGKVNLCARWLFYVIDFTARES